MPQRRRPVTPDEEKAFQAFRSLRFRKAGLSAPLIQRFLDSGITGTQLARNPNTQIAIATRLRDRVDKQTQSRRGVVQPKDDSLLGRFAFDFFREEQRLREDFVQREITKRFGPQQIGTPTTIVGAGGKREVVPGNPQGRKPTDKEVSGIRDEFKTPFEKATGEKPISEQNNFDTLLVPLQRFGSAVKNAPERQRSLDAAKLKIKEARKRQLAPVRETEAQSRVLRRSIRKKNRQTLIAGSSDADIGSQTILG